MSERKILLIGGGGHCRSCIDVIEAKNNFSIAGIVEKQGKRGNGSISGYPVIGDDKNLEDLKKKYDYALITVGQIGTSSIRQRIFKNLKDLGFVLPVVVSPLAHVSRHAKIHEGTIVMHRAVVNAGAVIGRNCILNTQCIIEHDVSIGDHTHVSTAAVINGEAQIGAGSFVGSNATVVQGARLPDSYFYKAASLVINEISGNPVKELDG